MREKVRTTADSRRRIDIERLLVWTYRGQRADVVLDRGVGLLAIERCVQMGVVTTGTVAARSSWGTISEIQELGVSVDRSAAGSSHLHPDAERVHQAVLRLEDEFARDLVILHARTGDRPDWKPRARPKFRPVLNQRGTPKIFYDATDRGRHLGFCRVVWIETQADIEYARDAYRCWRTALDRVWHILASASLLDHVPLSAAAPREPWAALRESA